MHFHPAKIHRLFLQHLEMTLGSAAQLKWFFKNNILRIKDRKIRDKYIEEAFYFNVKNVKFLFRALFTNSYLL